MTEEYPEYSWADIGDEECYELYAEKLKDFAELDKDYEYPLTDSKHIDLLGDVGRTGLDEIDPCLFVDLAKPKAHIRQCSLPYIMDAYKYGKPKLEPVYFSVNNRDNCQINGHQGRHRAQVACDLGINRIPIMINYRDYAYPDDETGFANLDLMKEANKYLRENGFKKYYKKYKDITIAPNHCYLINLKKEWSKSRYRRNLDRFYRFLILDAKRRRLRKEYGITEISNKIKRSKERKYTL